EKIDVGARTKRCGAHRNANKSRRTTDRRRFRHPRSIRPVGRRGEPRMLTRSDALRAAAAIEIVRRRIDARKKLGAIGKEARSRIAREVAESEQEIEDADHVGDSERSVVIAVAGVETGRSERGAPREEEAADARRRGRSRAGLTPAPREGAAAP